MKLPVEFENRMQDMLQEAYPAFLRSYENEKQQSLRVNTCKGSKEEFMTKMSFWVEQIPWEQNGLYYKKEDQPGKHPWHEAGVYYIQEPSAMSPVAYLDVKPGDRVMDLCAAPGGKSTQIAAYLQQEGLLVCNEIHPARAKILSENVERMGIRNALVTNETPQKLAETFDGFFDKILVDAPCSGEGMFRKNEDAGDEWSLANVKICANRQDQILDCADTMLKPGGRLVFSTCTFAPAENEGSIWRFLQRHKDYEIVEVPLYEGMSHGNPKWALQYQYDPKIEEPVYLPVDEEMLSENEKAVLKTLEKTIRLWPHICKGEGHYLAVLQKKGDAQGYQGFLKYGYEKGAYPQSAGNAKGKKREEKGSKNTKKGNQHTVNIQDGISAFLDFQKETLQIDLLEKENNGFLAFGEQLYLLPKDMPSIHGLKVLRPGLHLGTMKKERFEPSHALALFLKAEEVKRVCPLSAKAPEAAAFINGQTLNYDGEKGWYLITVDGYSLGWGKLAGQVMKNHFPKGLRKG